LIILDTATIPMISFSSFLVFLVPPVFPAGDSHSCTRAGLCVVLSCSRVTFFTFDWAVPSSLASSRSCLGAACISWVRTGTGDAWPVSKLGAGSCWNRAEKATLQSRTWLSHLSHPLLIFRNLLLLPGDLQL